VRTPNYHVQALFSLNRGDRILPVKLTGLTAGEEKRLYASATLDEKAGEVILKLVNATAIETRPTIELNGARKTRAGTLTLLQAEGPAENTFAAPGKVMPRTSPFLPAGGKFELTLPANSVTVLRVGI
jgi:alpha-L-arabinofuranosidase